MAKDKIELILTFGSKLKILMLKNERITNSEIHQIDSNDIIDGIIFNMTKIEKILADFIDRYALRSISTTIMLTDNLVIQALNKNLDLNPRVYHLRTYEFQFYPDFFYYNLAISHYQIFQYSLLCEKLSLKLTAVTTQTLYLYTLFKKISFKKIDSSLHSIPSLKKFFKETINEYKLQRPICNSTVNFDSIFDK